MVRLTDNPGRGSASLVVRHKGGFRWKTVKTEPYKKTPEGWTAICRNVLIGREGCNSSLHLRYFEINKGGNSSLEYHKHEHIVVCIKGRGRILIDEKTYSVNPFDAVYIAPGAVHQLTNPHDEPFGFFCIVKARRDRPVHVKTPCSCRKRHLIDRQ